MIAPTAETLIDLCLHSLNHTVAPALTGYSETSAVRTMTHLLRFIALRQETEGQILLDDISALDELLPKVRGFFVSRSIADVESATIDSVLRREPREPSRYVTLAMLAEDAGPLRAALYAAQQFLIAHKHELSAQPEYLEIRRRIRAYVGHQLEAEGRMVDAAFMGRGPRR
jgi:hypothetical protein